MKKILLLLCCLFPLMAHSAVTSESLCFELSETSPVKFELRTYYDEASKWSGGFVKYAKSNEPISIVLTDSENEILDPDAPWQHTRTWSEVVNGKVTGSYELMTQGSQIVSMSYTKQSNSKVYSFGFNTSIDSSLESGCKWE
ncbi:hypothetical protein IAI51_02875 [Pseudomonas sp. N40(2020)]|uniref:hypothetical protein n=1 Tax=Pseudomonas sp. N40(2020) TaxID=2767798 RepID=UPI001656D67C|nr:hypothetical protein [Pseudomonas sp. N40(2020)]MBC8995470.1 hypothetical protein [Pseudomonas sp. N40(2020)]